MKRTILIILFAQLVTSCSGWTVQPLPYNPPTPFVIPSNTPAIYSPTPVVIGSTSTPEVIPATETPTLAPTSTEFASTSPTNTETSTTLQTIILGCNTSIDISHGMGEVTNAFITIMNNSQVDLTNIVVTLYALDEGREHPDKIQEIPILPAQYEITLLMTVDSTYNQESPVQLEVKSDQGLFPREGVDSCKDIGLFAPNPDGLKTPIPSNP